MVDGDIRLVQLEIQLQDVVSINVTKQNAFNIPWIIVIIGIFAVFLIRLIFVGSGDDSSQFEKGIVPIPLNRSRVRRRCEIGLPVVVHIIILNDVFRRYGQGTEILCDMVVRRSHTAPVDAVGVRAAADFRLGAGRGHCDHFLIGLDQTCDARFGFRQRSPVVGLAGRTRRDFSLKRQDLQAAGTDVDADLVVIILRQFFIGQPNIIGIIASVALLNADVFQAGSGLVISRLGLDRIPNIVKILRLIAGMADHYIVIHVLVRIRETGLIGRAIVLCAGPAVGLDTDGDVNLRHFQRAADIAHLVVIGIYRLVTRIQDHRIRRRDRGDTGIEAAVILRAVVGIGIREADAAKFMVLRLQEPIHRHLTAQLRRKGQRRAVIGLAVAVNGDRHLLLIEQSEGQAARDGRIVDVIGLGFRRRTTVDCTLDSLIQLPADDGRAGQGVCLVLLYVLDVRVQALDRNSVHIHKVDGDLRALIGGIIEAENVRSLICGEDEGLLHLVGVEFQTAQLRMVRQQCVIHRRSQLNDGGSISGDILFGLIRGHANIAGILFRVEDILHRIAGRFTLCFVNKGDHVPICRQRDRFAVCLRAIAGNGNGLLCDGLPNHEVRVAHDLVSRHGLIAFIHIVDGVAQSLAAPVGIDRRIPGDLQIPVKEGIPLGAGEPAFEGIARFRRRPGIGRLLILLYRLTVEQLRRIIRIQERNRKGGCIPIGIELHIVPGHRGEAEALRKGGVRIPSAEGVVAVQLGRSVRGVIVRIAVDICFK